MKWNVYDCEAKSATAPDPALHDELVWIVEDGEVDLGYFDGFTFRRWTGSDDVSVTHWAPVTWPEWTPEAPASVPPAVFGRGAGFIDLDGGWNR